MDLAAMFTLFLGPVIALFVGIQMNAVPEGIIGDAVAHPMRWWYSGGIAMFTTISALIMMALSAIIEELEQSNERAEDAANKKPKSTQNPNKVEELIARGEYNPNLDR